MSAIFTIDQATLPAGIPDRARRDIIPGGSVVQFTATTVPPGHATYKWEFVSQPDGVALTFSNPAIYNPTVDFGLNYGGYLVRLTVDESLVTEDVSVRYVGLAWPVSSLPVPAVYETNQDNSQAPYTGERGWEDKFFAYMWWLEQTLTSVIPSIDATYDNFGATPATVDIDNAEGQGSLQWNVTGDLDFIVDVSTAGNPYVGGHVFNDVRGLQVNNGTDFLSVGRLATNQLAVQGYVENVELYAAGSIGLEAVGSVAVTSTGGNAGLYATVTNGVAEVKAADGDVNVEAGDDLYITLTPTDATVKGIYVEYDSSNQGNSSFEIYQNAVKVFEATVLGDIGVTNDLIVGDQILADDGLITAPGISFTSQVDTGIYHEMDPVLGNSVKTSIDGFDCSAIYYQNAPTPKISTLAALSTTGQAYLEARALYAHSTTNDIGGVSFVGQDDAGTPLPTDYANIHVKATDITTTAGYGQLRIETLINGSPVDNTFFGAGVMVGSGLGAQDPGAGVLRTENGIQIGPSNPAVEWTVDGNGHVSSTYAGTLTTDMWEIDATASGASTASLTRLIARGTGWTSAARGLEILTYDSDFVPLEIIYDSGSPASVFKVLSSGKVELVGPIEFSGSSGAIRTVSIGADIHIVPESTGVTHIGEGGTPTYVSTNDDLYVTNDLEIEGTVNLKTASVSTYLHLNDDIPILFGDSSDAQILWEDAHQTNPGIFLGVGSSAYFAICETGDLGDDFTIPNYTNPTFVIQSADSSVPAERLWLQHDGTNAVLGVDTGNLMIGSLTSYTLPTSTGIENQALVLDGSDDLQWSYINDFKDVKDVTTATYTALITDRVLHVTRTATGACLITIPSALIASDKYFVRVKDAGFDSSTSNITVQTESGEMIDNLVSPKIINSDGAALYLYSDGSDLFSA